MKDEIQEKLMEVFRGVCDGSVPVDQAVGVARLAREHTRRDERRLKELALRFEVTKACRMLNGKDGADLLPTLEQLETGAMRRIKAA